ncbi:collagenase [Streptomyces sp. N2-109]|uniref:microbial collagenase n=1 Tax=Streptomyces gossypii TaxID=2883101 RepID=A0ABT2JKS8_9ACTN|nr:collagenase [Streptomyces gossypii]MCT2588495.1 collagenase [Streptomyces gossypii]
MTRTWVLALALALGGGVLSGPGFAAPRTDAAPESARETPAGLPPQAALQAPAGDPEHVREKALKVHARAPLTSSKDALKQDYDSPVVPEARKRPSMKAAKGTQGKAKAGAADCNVSDFTSRTGRELVRQIKKSPTACVNTLFNLTGGDAYYAFREKQMVTVANAMRDGSAAYPGDGSTGMPQLVLYLRAGYYVHWYNEPDVGEYGRALRSAVRGGLDAFFGSPRSGDVTDANGETLAEAVILIDSAEQNARYLSVVKRMLDGYDSSYDSSWWMLTAVNNVYTVLFRGHQVPEFVSAVTSDPSVLDTLHGFATEHGDLLGGDQSYLTSNAGRELARFLQHDALREHVRPQALDLLNQSSITGDTATLWVGIAEMTGYYDQRNCSYYDTCNLQERLEKEVLPVEHTCSDSLRVRAQAMTSGELGRTCDSLAGQDAYFHGIAQDNGPVEGDRNTSLEVVAFDSSTDYQTYAGVMFGIDTNNGGMYLEGDPSAQGNQPRFIAYEAEWLKPEFQIWNLNHEYTHYLDGRFNMHGDFEANVSTPTIMWIEGFAEYVSYSYRNLQYDDAIAEAGRGTYALSALFDTTYSHDSARVYQWGYLAVRYMVQSHRNEVDTLLDYYRSGDWNGARSYLTRTIGSSHDGDWYTWLASCSAGDCGQ